MAHPSSRAQPGGATLALDTFTLPDFPPQASGLIALTLTSAIPLPDYETQLRAEFSLGTLPQGIQSLTLELFSLGYPPGFLEKLAERLPNLKSLVLYNQLLTGTTPSSSDDAVRFFALLKGVRALHMLDCFSWPGFVARVAPELRARERGVMFLEVNYTFSHEEGFLERVPGGELAGLVGRGLISCSFNIAPAEKKAVAEPGILGEGAQSGKSTEMEQEGVRALDAKYGQQLVDAFVGEETRPAGLKALNCTLYTLSVGQLKQICEAHRGLMILNATVATSSTIECRKAIIDAVSGCASLEQLEIVADAGSSTEGKAALFEEDDLRHLSEMMPKLAKYTGNVRRDKSKENVHWEKVGGYWKRGFPATSK